MSLNSPQTQDSPALSDAAAIDAAAEAAAAAALGIEPEVDADASVDGSDAAADTNGAPEAAATSAPAITAAPAEEPADEFAAVADKWATPAAAPAKPAAAEVPQETMRQMAERIAAEVLARARAGERAEPAAQVDPEDETEEQRLTRVISGIIDQKISPLVEHQRRSARAVAEEQRTAALSAYQESIATAEFVKTDPELADDFRRSCHEAAVTRRLQIAFDEGAERPLTAAEAREVVADVNGRHMRGYARGHVRARSARRAAPTPAAVERHVAPTTTKPAPAAATRPTEERPKAEPKRPRSHGELMDGDAIADRYRVFLN